MTQQTVAVKTAKVRRDNLRKLIQEADGPTALARKLGYKNAAFLVTMAGPHPTREVTEKNARAIEAKLGLLPHSLDAVPPSAKRVQAATPTGSDAMDMDLMREAMLRVAEHLEARDIKLVPAKFVEVVLFVYVDAVEKGSPSDEVIRRAVQLAK